ncbi:hypothetical protein WA158_006462 [Blastocystis sp. Blastoise]
MRVASRDFGFNFEPNKKGLDSLSPPLLSPVSIHKPYRVPIITKSNTTTTNNNNNNSNNNILELPYSELPPDDTSFVNDEETNEIELTNSNCSSQPYLTRANNSENYRFQPRKMSISKGENPYGIPLSGTKSNYYTSNNNKCISNHNSLNNFKIDINVRRAMSTPPTITNNRETNEVIAHYLNFSTSNHIDTIIKQSNMNPAAIAVDRPSLKSYIPANNQMDPLEIDDTSSVESKDIEREINRKKLILSSDYYNHLLTTYFGYFFSKLFRHYAKQIYTMPATSFSTLCIYMSFFLKFYFKNPMDNDDYYNDMRTNISVSNISNTNNSNTNNSYNTNNDGISLKDNYRKSSFSLPSQAVDIQLITDIKKFLFTPVPKYCFTIFESFDFLVSVFGNINKSLEANNPIYVYILVICIRIIYTYIKEVSEEGEQTMNYTLELHELQQQKTIKTMSNNEEIHSMDQNSPDINPCMCSSNSNSTEKPEHKTKAEEYFPRFVTIVSNLHGYLSSIPFVAGEILHIYYITIYSFIVFLSYQLPFDYYSLLSSHLTSMLTIVVIDPCFEGYNIEAPHNQLPLSFINSSEFAPILSTFASRITESINPLLSSASSLPDIHSIYQNIYVNINSNIYEYIYNYIYSSYNTIDESLHIFDSLFEDFIKSGIEFMNIAKESKERNINIALFLLNEYWSNERNIYDYKNINDKDYYILSSSYNKEGGRSKMTRVKGKEHYYYVSSKIFADQGQHNIIAPEPPTIKSFMKPPSKPISQTYIIILATECSYCAELYIYKNCICICPVKKPEDLNYTFLTPSHPYLLPHIPLILPSYSFLNIYTHKHKYTYQALELFYKYKGIYSSIVMYFPYNNKDDYYNYIYEMLREKSLSPSPNEPIVKYINRINLDNYWKNGYISTFAYLLMINRIAGRSFFDISQYPVFPWLCQQYEGDKIDLTCSIIYRDLSLPISILSPSLMNHCQERYESCDDGVLPPFHFGTHYSTLLGAILYYLIRVEPFTGLHTVCQNGHFDLPDRLFTSIPSSFSLCISSISDTREFIPDMFYLYDLYSNYNNAPFGLTQDQQDVSTLSLPDYCSDASSYMSILHQQIESPYVSSNISKWIDLIFGYKQHGSEGIKAHNIYYYTTYIDAPKYISKDDDRLLSTLYIQSVDYGQCPIQIYNTMHINRSLTSYIPRRLISLLPFYSNYYGDEPQWIGYRGIVCNMSPICADLPFSSFTPLLYPSDSHGKDFMPTTTPYIPWNSEPSNSYSIEIDLLDIYICSIIRIESGDMYGSGVVSKVELYYKLYPETEYSLIKKYTVGSVTEQPASCLDLTFAAKPIRFIRLKITAVTGLSSASNLLPPLVMNYVDVYGRYLFPLYNSPKEEVILSDEQLEIYHIIQNSTPYVVTSLGLYSLDIQYINKGSLPSEGYPDWSEILKYTCKVENTIPLPQSPHFLLAHHKNFPIFLYTCSIPGYIYVYSLNNTQDVNSFNNYIYMYISPASILYADITDNYIVIFDESNTLYIYSYFRTQMGISIRKNPTVISIFRCSTLPRRIYTSEDNDCIIAVYKHHVDIYNLRGELEYYILINNVYHVLLTIYGIIIYTYSSKQGSHLYIYNYVGIMIKDTNYENNTKITSFVVSDDDLVLFTGDEHGEIRLWNLIELYYYHSLLPAFNIPITSLCLHNNDSCLIAACKTNSLFVISLANSLPKNVFSKSTNLLDKVSQLPYPFHF